MLQAKLALYEKAQVRTEQAIHFYDNLAYLWRQLKRAFDLFDDQGNIASPQEKMAEIFAIIELMQQLNCENLNQELVGFAKALPVYQDYFVRAKTSYTQLAEMHGIELVNLVGVAWQYHRQALNCRNYYLKQALLAQSQHYLTWAEAIAVQEFSSIQTNIFETLNANIRASSLVENIKRATCKGER